MRQFCHGHKRKRPAPRRKPLNSVVGRVGIEPTTNGLRELADRYRLLKINALQRSPKVLEVSQSVFGSSNLVV